MNKQAVEHQTYLNEVAPIRSVNLPHEWWSCAAADGAEVMRQVWIQCAASLTVRRRHDSVRHLVLLVDRCWRSFSPLCQWRHRTSRHIAQHPAAAIRWLKSNHTTMYIKYFFHERHAILLTESKITTMQLNTGRTRYTLQQRVHNVVLFMHCTIRQLCIICRISVCKCMRLFLL